MKYPHHVTLPGMQMIETIIRTVISTGQIRDAVPVSLMIVGPSGGGKSKTLLAFKGAAVHLTDDMTSTGLADIIKADKDSAITHIMLPDFNPVLSHKASVTGLTVANLLGITQDGTIRIDDGREVKELEHQPMGILTAVTPLMYEKNLHKWDVIGFRRRFLTIHFDYSPGTIKTAMDLIGSGLLKGGQLVTVAVNAPKEKQAPRIVPGLNADIDQIAGTMSSHLAAFVGVKVQDGHRQKKWFQGRPVPPMSPKHMCRWMAQAHAFNESRPVVSKQDIAFLLQLLEFTDPTRPKLL